VITINKGILNTFALTLTEKLDLNYPNFYYLFVFQNKMTLEEKFFISTDTSGQPSRFNLFELIEGSSEDFNAPVPTVLLEEGSWVYDLYQMNNIFSPQSFDPAFAVKHLEDGKVWVKPTICEVPAYGDVPIVKQYITDCYIQRESIDFESIGYECIEPLKGGGNITINFSVTDGTGPYNLELSEDGGMTWYNPGFGDINPPTDAILIGSDAVETFLTRIIDTTTSIYSNELILNLVSCVPVTESIVLDSITYGCDAQEGSTLDFNYTGTLTSGNYTLQAYFNGVWNSVEFFTGPTTGSSSHFLSVPQLPFAVPFTIDFRILDTDSPLVISNEIPQVFVECDFLHFSDTSFFDCGDPGNTDVIAHIGGQSSGQSGNYVLEVDTGSGFVALSDLAFVGTGDGNWGAFPLNLNNSTFITIGDWVGQSLNFRVVDTVTLFVSNTISYVIPNCTGVETSLTLDNAFFSCVNNLPFETVDLTAVDCTGNYMVQVYFNGGWFQVAQFMAATTGTFSNTNELPVFFIINPGTYDIRVFDGITLSNTLTITSEDCASSIILNYFDQTYTFFNATGINVQSLNIQESSDNVNWTDLPLATLAIPTTPWTGTDSLSWAGGTFGGLVDGMYYRIKAYDSFPLPIYSNSLQYVYTVVTLNTIYPIGCFAADFVNAYSYTGGNLDVELIESTDGGFSGTAVANSGSVLLTDPFNGNLTVCFPYSPVIGRWYQLGVQSSIGTIIGSNFVLYIVSSIVGPVMTDVGSGNTDIGVVYNTIYHETSVGIGNVSLEISADNLSWVPFIPLAIGTEPYTNIQTYIAVAGIPKGNYYRVIGEDSLGNQIISTSSYYPNQPIAVKAEGGCFANQQFITIGGTDDLLFTGQTYNVQWSPTGLGNWTNIGTVASVAGVMSDADYNVGVGNAEAGNTLDFRFQHSTIPAIVSNILTETMLGAC
jgi:hypothetical protein